VVRNRFALIAAAFAAVGGGTVAMAAQSAGAATAHPAAGTVLKVASVKVAIGTTNKAHKLLVDARGRAVYLLTGDSSTHPKCTSASCRRFWPPVTTTSAKKPAVGAGITGRVGVWHHKGIYQVTINGHPLYTYAQDSKGSALGEGIKSFGGLWWVVTPAGKPMTKSSSGSGGGGGSSWS
jgi:predicted lipoprotein with Yx(FWY)xxD motif